MKSAARNQSPKPDELFGDVDTLEAWVPVEHHDAIGAANLARSVLGADAAWITRRVEWHPDGSDHPELMECWYVKGLHRSTKIVCLSDWGGEEENAEAVHTFYDFVHRSRRAWTTVQRVSDAEDVRRHLARIAADDNCQVAVLAMHGSPGSVRLGPEPPRLEELLDGVRLPGKVLHFAACSVLRVSPRRLQALQRTTKAAVVSGYRRDIEWYQSEAFELLLLQELAAGTAGGTRGLRSAVKRAMANAGGLAETVGFTSSLDATEA